jgi:hypothetical protein
MKGREGQGGLNGREKWNYGWMDEKKEGKHDRGIDKQTMYLSLSPPHPYRLLQTPLVPPQENRAIADSAA